MTDDEIRKLGQIVAEYVARGVDAIIFDDASGNGSEHKTLRLLSDRAIAAVAVAV